jgi:tRNA(adenine34) deaminase
MCAGAIVLSKIENLYFGSFDPKSGACGSTLDITHNKIMNHKCKVYGGILDSECGEILKSFFKSRRKV